MSEALNVHELRECPACAAEDSSAFTLGTTPLERCRECGLVFSPRYGDPSEIYVEGYLFGQTDFGLDVMHPVFQEYLSHASRIRLELIERVTGRRGSVLDVGCGTGEFLEVAERRGWDAAGVEPVAESAAYAVKNRGLRVLPVTLEESGLPERSFDLVTAFHVVEHMTDAVGFLSSMARWAKPGGFVATEVPNWHSFHRRNAGSAWSGLRPLEHIGHYSPGTLKAAFRRAGLDPVFCTTPGFLWHKQTLDQQLDDLGFYRLEGHLNRLGRRGEQDGKPAVMARALPSAVLRGVQSLYARLGVGQVVLVVGQAR